MPMHLFGYLTIEIFITASHRAKIWPGLCRLGRYMHPNEKWTMVKKPSPLFTCLERKMIHVHLLMTCILLFEGVTRSYGMDDVCRSYATCVTSLGSWIIGLCIAYSRRRFRFRASKQRLSLATLLVTRPSWGQAYPRSYMDINFY
jgi:hypothetical protein